MYLALEGVAFSGEGEGAVLDFRGKIEFILGRGERGRFGKGGKIDGVDGWSFFRV